MDCLAFIEVLKENPFELIDRTHKIICVAILALKRWGHAHWLDGWRPTRGQTQRTPPGYKDRNGWERVDSGTRV